MEVTKLTEEEEQATNRMIHQHLEEIKIINERVLKIGEEQKNLNAEQLGWFPLIKEIVEDMQEHLKNRVVELRSQIIFCKAALNIK